MVQKNLPAEMGGALQENGWNPFTGVRTFKSANQAWEQYGKYRFSISKRCFLNYVGKACLCPPASDGVYHVEDIEFISQSKAWPPTLSFVGPLLPQGDGGKDREEIHYGALYQREKALKEAVLREKEELDLAKKKAELMPVAEYEQRLSAAAAVVGMAAETFAYESTREIIHVCDGDPTKEDVLREYLLERMRSWTHAFSQPAKYDIEFVPEENTDSAEDAV